MSRFDRVLQWVCSLSCGHEVWITSILNPTGMLSWCPICLSLKRIDYATKGGTK